MCLFNYNLPPSFRNKTTKMTSKLSLVLHGAVRYGTHTAVFLKKYMHFCCTYSIKTKIKYYQWFVLDFLKIAKINPQWQKTQSALIANSSSRKIQKNLQSAKINFRKNFVSHGMHYQEKYYSILTLVLKAEIKLYWEEA